MIKILDRELEKQHFEDLTKKNPEKLSESQRDYITFYRLKEEYETGLE